MSDVVSYGDFVSVDDSSELTLRGAKSLLLEMILSCESSCSSGVSYVDGLRSALRIFERVGDLSDEMRAVLWLIGEQGRVLVWRGEWLEQTFDLSSRYVYDYVRIDPLAEAKRLNWEDWMRENSY